MPPKKGKPGRPAKAAAPVKNVGHQGKGLTVAKQQSTEEGDITTFDSVTTVVSPEKPPVDREARTATWYMINSKTFAYRTYSKEQDALTAVGNTMALLDPGQTPIFTILPFFSLPEFQDHLVQMKKGNQESSKKASFNSIASPKRAAISTPTLSSVAKAPKLGSSFSRSSILNSDKMEKFSQKVKASNSQLEVFHLKLDTATHDIWGFTYKENNKLYWSWKPNVIEKMIEVEKELGFFADEGTSLEVMLSDVKAALIRATPRGPNIAQEIKINTKGTTLKSYLILGFIPTTDDEETVKAFALDFFSHFKNEDVQGLYYKAMESSMNASNIINDCLPVKGELWSKLANATEKMTYRKLHCLSELLMDETIHEIMEVTYGFAKDKGSSFWSGWVKKLAFGEEAESE